MDWARDNFNWSIEVSNIVKHGRILNAVNPPFVKQKLVGPKMELPWIRCKAGLHQEQPFAPMFVHLPMMYKNIFPRHPALALNFPAQWRIVQSY